MMQFFMVLSSTEAEIKIQARFSPVLNACGFLSAEERQTKHQRIFPFYIMFYRRTVER